MNSKTSIVPVIIEDVVYEYADTEVLIYNTKNQTFYQLNSLGSLIWNLIDGKTSLNKIKKKLSQQFEIEDSIVHKDLINFIMKLKKLKLIKMIFYLKNY